MQIIVKCSLKRPLWKGRSDSLLHNIHKYYIVFIFMYGIVRLYHCKNKGNSRKMYHCIFENLKHLPSQIYLVETLCTTGLTMESWRFILHIPHNVNRHTTCTQRTVTVNTCTDISYQDTWDSGHLLPQLGC